MTQRTDSHDGGQLNVAAYLDNRRLSLPSGHGYAFPTFPSAWGVMIWFMSLPLDPEGVVSL